MVAYGIDYTLRNTEGVKTILVDAKDIQSAKKKIGKKHGYKDGRMVQIKKVNVIGYF